MPPNPVLQGYLSYFAPLRPPQEWGRQRKKADVRVGKRLGWEETRCEEGVLFARKNSERQAPVFKKPPAFRNVVQVSFGPLDQPGQDGASSGRRRKVGRRTPLADSTSGSGGM